MSTRSITKVHDQFNGNVIAQMFVHFDGYPTGVGADIKKALKGITVVNGICGNEPKPFVNRMGKLASYLVKNSDIDFEFCEGKEQWIDYEYNLHFDNGIVSLNLVSSGKSIYAGPLDDFDPQKVEDAQSDDE